MALLTTAQMDALHVAVMRAWSEDTAFLHIGTEIDAS